MNFSKFFVSDLTLCLVNQVVNELADVHCPVVEMSTRSKLSCLSWNKYIKSHIASSDYEGIITVWDVNTHQVCLPYPYFRSYRGMSCWCVV